MTILGPFVLVFALLLVTFMFVAIVRSRVRIRQFAALSEHDLIKKLHTVPLEAITTLALEHLYSSAEHTSTDPRIIWRMLGGSEGLRSMTDNAEVMIAMAAYMERWNPNGVQFEVARMRRDGVLLRRAAGCLGRSVIAANSVNVSLYAHEAASTYYLMTQRLKGVIANAPNNGPQSVGTV